MARGKYEGSKADEANDKRMAKKKGVPLKKWEASAADKKMDAAGQKKLNAKMKGKKRKGG